MRAIPILIFLFILIGCKNEKKKVTLNQLITHYNKIEVPQSYSIDFTNTRFVPYQVYDYKNVDGLTANHIIEIDGKRKQAYNKRLTNVAGGFEFESITAVKDTTAIDYSLNKIWDGNFITSLDAKEEYNYLQKTGQRKLSVFEAKKLLETPKDSLIYVFDSKTLDAIITKNGKKDTLVYTFSTQPIQLKEIKNSAESRIFKNFKTYKGFSYASEYSYVKNKDTTTTPLKVKINSFKEIDKIDANKFSTPKGYTFEKPIVNKDKLSKIGKNTYIIRDFKRGRNVLFVVKNNVITVIGAPVSNTYSKEVIETIEKKFPKGKIKFVYVTHMHNDHIAGLQEYANKNATIIADAFTIEGIKDFDQFKETSNQFKFKTIKDREIFNGIQFHYPKNRHCKMQGFAYIIKDQLVYQGDFMQVSSNLTVPSILPEATKHFIERIYEDKLAVKTVIGQHQAGNEIPMTFLNKYYKKHQ
ncbi:hypothetical protein [Polaribacter cellanae]|uniref:Metallo-beta-lactamase domain-containing protein n=1 Tax=Polaribacter cellanae TaxID=2818493 RepID=A0A975CNY0_9FLAO|nr:hypothetical protein [Polaribacter cellanae]QTE22690.1 hypothetical protein J3359_18175 [Polaribacter cellanae]